MRWEGKGHDLRASIFDVAAYAGERMGHTSFQHCITYGMVAALLCCDLAGHWK